MSGAFKAASSLINDAGSGMTVPWPSGHKAGDKGILVASVSGIVSTSVPSTPSGWTLIGTTEANNSSVYNRITVWWLDATSGAMASAVVPSGGYTGNTGCAQMFTYSGALTGAPDVALATAQTFTDNISSPGVTTTVVNDLIIAVATQHSSDANKTISGWACSSLANVLEYSDAYVSSNLGGQAIGLGMACGIARATGATGAITATWSSVGSYLVGGMLVIALKPAATTTVTRDATDLRWYVASEAEFNSLYDGDAFPVPGEMWQMSEPSGSLIDVLGNQNLTLFNAPQFHQVAAGHSRFAIGYTGVNDCHYAASAPSDGLGNAANSSMVFGAVAWGATPTVAKNLINFGGGPGDRHLQLSTTGHYQIIGPGQATGAGAASPGTSVRPVVFQHDHTNAAIVAQTDQETIAPTYTAPSGGSPYFSIGPDSIGDSSTQELWLIALAWAGRKAEVSASMRATLIDRHLNGPRVASIAVTPTSYSLAPLATQQMTATATRADGSTYDCTATATWTSGTPSVATVSATGLVTGVAGGTSNITASFTSLNAATATSPAQVATVTSGITTPTKYTSMLMSLLPPGKVWRLIGNTVLFNVLAANADELGRLDARTTDLLREAVPSTAVELLPQYESELAIIPGAGDTNAQRQARIVARLVARQGYRPVDFQTALAPLLAQLPANVVVLERTAAFAASIGDVREIFRFFIYRDPALYPHTAAALAAAVGYGTWSNGWLFNATSGAVPAAFGATSLAALSTPVYALPGPQGAADLSVGFDSANDGFSAGNIDDPGTGDFIFAWVAKFTATPVDSDIMIKTVGGSNLELRTISGAYRLDIGDGTHNVFSLIGATAPIGTWHVGMFVVDRAANTMRMATINIDGTGATLGPATSISTVGSLTNVGALIFGSALSTGAFGSGAPTTLNLSAAFVGAGVGAATGMSANLATAVANLATTLRALALPYFLASAQTLVNAIKPSHTVGTVIESVSFLCDDAHSLCDRDLLGA